MLLSLDTSTNELALCLLAEGQIKAELLLDSPYTHAKILFSSIEQILESLNLQRSSITGLGACLGPGSFTGLRVGLATMQGLAASLGVPVAGVSKLDLIAHNLNFLPEDGSTTWVVMDARKHMVYVAPFKYINQEMTRLAPDGAADMHRLKEIIKAPAILTGSGAEHFLNLSKNITIKPYLPPRPASLALMCWQKIKNGEVLTIPEIKPNYCRPSDAEKVFNFQVDNYNLL